MSSRERDERGQILSSYAALAAVVAIIAGLVVLVTTRDDESAAGPQPAQPTAGTSDTPKSAGPVTPSASSPVPVTTTPPTTPPTAPTTPAPPATTTPLPTRSVTGTPPATATPVPATPPAVTTSTNRPTARASRIPASELPAVEVYNNTRRKGLAEQVGDRARAVGWTVTGADNWRGRVAASTVYYPPGMQDAADQLAGVLGISRTKEALPNMKKDRLSVILTSDYAG